MNGSMAENTTKDIWNDDDGAKEPPKKRRMLRKFLIFLLVLIAVLGLVLVAAWRDGTGFDALRRYFAYGTEAVGGEKTVYHYDTDNTNRFARVGANSLVILSDTSLRLLGPDGSEVWTRFVGDFNAYNLLAVYASARLLDFGKEELLPVMSMLVPVSGRFETILSNEGVMAIVDYAHTPDALENVLSTIEGLKKEGLVIGGDRDRTKRPEMAEVACRLSDRVILTSDNPRSEEPAAIIEDMRAGVPKEAASRVLAITDRKEAIRVALMLAKKGDIVLVAGKGHEDYQEIKGVKHHFDDKEVIKEIFKL
jgi:UDP-N-acetylmuramoyl-L-alanyl-D-glutamate--2,6-diaminopimelate ligase